LLLRPLPGGSCSSARFGRELPDTSGRQEVHHHLVAFLYGEKLRDFHVSASARSPSSCLPHLLPERSLLVSPLAVVAEEILLHLGYRPASAAAPPALVVVSVSELFYTRPHWRVSGLQLVEPGCQRLHTVHWDGSLVSCIAFQSIAVVLTAFLGLPLSLRCRLCFGDSSGPVRRRGVHLFSYCACSVALSRLIRLAICFLISWDARVSWDPVDFCLYASFVEITCALANPPG